MEPYCYIIQLKLTGGISSVLIVEYESKTWVHIIFIGLFFKISRNHLYWNFDSAIQSSSGLLTYLFTLGITVSSFPVLATDIA